jgi:AcrR family transcriptional regulator
VPRTRAPGRLTGILDAALHVFTTVGYRRARMQDVAEAAGVSPGLLYTYAAGKEALFLLTIQREAGVDVDTLPLPVPNPDPSELTTLITKTIRARMQPPALIAAEKSARAPRDVRAELAAIVAEHYDGVYDCRRLLRLIEKCAIDWPELAEAFFDRTRKNHVQRLGAYIARRSQTGQFVKVPDPDVAARFLIETCAWFANHRYGDHDGAAIPEAVARATVVELVTNSLLAK